MEMGTFSGQDAHFICLFVCWSVELFYLQYLTLYVNYTEYTWHKQESAEGTPYKNAFGLEVFNERGVV